MPELTHAAQLSESCLLLVGDTEDGPSAASVEVADGNGSVKLSIQTPGTPVDQAAPDVRKLTSDIASLARRVLAPLDAQARTKALLFFASTLRMVPAPERYQLSETLFGIREALRERLPLMASDDRPVDVTRIVSIDESSIYVEGLLRTADLVRLTAISPEGSRYELLDRLFRQPTDDQEPSGFTCLIELDVPSLRTDGWVFELETNRGLVAELEGPGVIEDARDSMEAILASPLIAPVPDDTLMERHVVPAISRLQQRTGTGAEVVSITRFGDVPQSAQVSIVVPLYLQIEHLEAQLVEFADDPQIREAELTYVLDSPQQSETLLSYATDLFPIYNLPFRIAVLDRNAGFAGANNAGAELATGRLLLLLNSDVLPDTPGWLRRMVEFHEATPDIGALGPKLLYEDNSIQHAGMYYHQLPGTSKWVDGHYNKGMHRSLAAANVTRTVPLVSGSCLMIERALYQEMGGLSSAYVQGDYEDAELCLKLWQGGRLNWYLPEVELYHLEGQSYGAQIRVSANRYNMWLHNHLWGEQIAELMSDPRFSG